MALDPQLLAERAHLDLARRCLAEMRAAADRVTDYGVDALASESLGRLRAQRLQALADDPDAAPFFGRTDRDPDDGRTGAEVLHIGRRHIRDQHGDPVVIDWRAPIARGFYRATPSDRMGVRLRRRFGFHAAELTSFEDEHLDRGETLGLTSGLLREEIERPRVGPMRDIVATIQPDQDDLVRADIGTSLCIQGAPGTGKTAVGLHRAAYLLYTYPERLRRFTPRDRAAIARGPRESGVLVVGPNPAFLHYIAQVLPALGEAGIEQTTIDALVRAPLGPQPPADEAAELATLKGDARMAEVLRRAVYTHVAKPAEDVVAIVGTRRYRIGAHHLRRYVDDARRALSDGLRWSVARDRLRTQLGEDVRRQREDAGGAPSDAETAKVARSQPVREFVDAVWPALDPAALLSRLYDDPAFLARCAAGVLDEDERRALYRPAARSRRRTRWSAADAVLLDELAGLLDGTDSYGHVVVDEAQDLSAMQCRAIARRCPLGSITVLGDLAQATTPWGTGDWTQTLRHLGHADAQLRALTAGYRVPEAVLALANRLLPHIAPGLAPASSVRAGVDALHFAAASSLVEQVRQCLRSEGSVGVIVPEPRLQPVLQELRAGGVAAEPVTAGADSRVTVVPAGAAKGLEFDSVVLLEPAEIVAAEPSRAAGLRRLYVVLTRAVSRLTVVHDQPLPEELAAVPAPVPR